MNNKNKFSVMAGSSFVLVAAILAIVVSIADIIQSIMSMIGTGTYGLILGFTMLILAIPMILIGVGLLLAFLNAKNGIVHSGGVSMVKASVMIRGIVSFIGGIFICIVLLILSFGLMLADAGAGMLGLLGTAVGIFLTICILLFALKFNKQLGIMRDYQSNPNINTNVSTAMPAMVLAVCSGLGTIGTFISLLATAVVADILKQYIGSFVPKIDDLLNKLVILIILMLISIIGRTVLYIFAFVANSRYKQIAQSDGSEVFDNNSHEQNQGTSFADNINVEFDAQLSSNDYEQDDDSSNNTVLINPNPVNIPDKPADVKVFEGKITSLSGKDKGFAYPIKDGEEIIIGKDPNVANIVVDKGFEKISRRHCGIKYDAVNDIYMVIDYSMNGTYINSVKKLSKSIYVKVPKGTIINLAKENLDYKLG